MHNNEHVIFNKHRNLYYGGVYKPVTDTIVEAFVFSTAIAAIAVAAELRRGPNGDGWAAYKVDLEIL